MGFCFTVALKLSMREAFMKPFIRVKRRQQISALFNIHNGKWQARRGKKIYIDYRQITSSEDFKSFCWNFHQPLQDFTVKLKIHRFTLHNLSCHIMRKNLMFWKGVNKGVETVNTWLLLNEVLHTFFHILIHETFLTQKLLTFHIPQKETRNIN